jgi:hypothetical protein
MRDLRGDKHYQLGWWIFQLLIHMIAEDVEGMKR